jgi:hypothetical protein
MRLASYGVDMKSLTVRLPETLVSNIEQESRARAISKSDVVRERLESRSRPPGVQTMHDLVGDLAGSCHGLPSDLSSNKKKYLPGLIRAKKLHR